MYIILVFSLQIQDGCFTKPQGALWGFAKPLNRRSFTTPLYRGVFEKYLHIGALYTHTFQYFLLQIQGVLIKSPHGGNLQSPYTERLHKPSRALRSLAKLLNRGGFAKS